MIPKNRKLGFIYPVKLSVCRWTQHTVYCSFFFFFLTTEIALFRLSTIMLIYIFTPPVKDLVNSEVL